MCFTAAYSYNLESSTWDAVPVSSGPAYRYGHSLALHQVRTAVAVLLPVCHHLAR